MKAILLGTAIFLLLTGVCVAADDGWQPLNTPGKPEGKTQPIKDDGFKSTSGGITESLLSPDKGDRSGLQTTESEWKSLKAGEAPKGKTQPIKTRSIKVLKKEKGVEVWETVKAPEKRTGGFVNLKIQFDVNSYTIRPTSHKILNELGKALSDPRLREKIITINGHTDSDGKEKYNVRLSLNRAGAVKQYLIDHYSISPDQLKVVGYGESMPLKPNTSKENKQLNRRVEIVAAKK